MERSWIKGGSFSSAGSMGQGTEGDTSCLRPGVEFSCGRQCVPLAALQRLEKGLAVVCPVPPVAAVLPHCLLPCQRTGQASLQGASSTRVSRGSCHAHNYFRCFSFLWPRAAACAVTSVTALAWAVLLGLVAKKRLSFPSSCLASAFWP